VSEVMPAPPATEHIASRIIHQGRRAPCLILVVVERWMSSPWRAPGVGAVVILGLMEFGRFVAGSLLGNS
jgi:hypothetical protein